MEPDERSLIYAIILEQLEADGLSLVRNILEDEYSSQFGSHEASELESTIATLETTIPGTQSTSLVRLLSLLQNNNNNNNNSNNTNSTTGTIPPPLNINTTSSQQISTPKQIKVDLRSHQRVRRRSSLAVSPCDPSQSMSEQPLIPRPVPDYNTLPQIEDLTLNDEGGMSGGNALGLLRWVCRCAWMIQKNQSEEIDLKETSNYETDLIDYLMTFTDFTTPEDLVNGLETILEQYPEEAWGIQQFIVRWLEYDFDQLPVRTRRGIIESIIELALTCVQATHHDQGENIEVTKISKSLVVNALPPVLVEVLRNSEASLCVDARGGARTPSSSIGSSDGIMMPGMRSPSHSFSNNTSSSPNSPSSRNRSPSSPKMSGGSGRKTVKPGNKLISPRSSRSSSFTGGSGDFFDYPIYLIAEQLTYVDHAMFRKIPTLEFLNKSWDRNRYSSVAEKTWFMTDRWNGMVEYLATLVLHGDGPDERASRIEYLVDLGNVLWTEYHNFHSACMVHMALDHLSLKTLKQSWERVNSKPVNDNTGPIPPNAKRQTVRERLRQVFWHENNFMNYRQTEKRVPRDLPMIPSMMVHHKYLFDTHEGAPHLLCRKCGSLNMKDADVCCKKNCKNPLDSNYRNFGRSHNLSRFVSELRRFQRTPYADIVPNREVCNFLNKGVQSHIMFFDTHSRVATKKMLIAGKALGATEN